MKTLLAGIIIGVGIASLFWLLLIDIGQRFESLSNRMDRSEQAIGLIIKIQSANQ
jgi:hypothetical protein